jgi:8-oxo-dGTP diphosphatase
VGLDEAAGLLTYERDAATVEEARPFVRRTHPLVVVRHAEARDRESWDGRDERRPLTEEGERQARLIVPVLAAYGVERLVSSSSTRCWTTLAPYGVAAGLDIEETDELSEEHWTDEGVAEEAEALYDLRRPVAVCSHRKVLPRLFEELGIDPPALDPAALVVVHHRKGRLAALERIPAPS